MCIRWPCRRSGCAPRFFYQHNYPPPSAYLCAALRNACRAPISPPFCVLGSWDARDIFPLSLFPMLPPLHTCLVFWVHGPPNFFLPHVFLVIHWWLGLFISFVAHHPLFFLAFFFFSFSPFPPCINIDLAHSSDYHIASYPSPLCYNPTSVFTSFFFSDVYGAILVLRCINWT